MVMYWKRFSQIENNGGKQFGKALTSYFQDALILVLNYEQEIECKSRLLEIEIGVQKFKKANRSFPSTLQELTPEFLRVIPVDPINNKGFRYIKESDSDFKLYSVGIDAADQDGANKYDVGADDHSEDDDIQLHSIPQVSFEAYVEQLPEYEDDNSAVR